MKTTSFVLFWAIGMVWAGDERGLFFREGWTKTPPFEEVTQDHLENRDLLQTLHGPSRDSIKKRHHGADEDPYYIWSGACTQNWAVSLRHQKKLADLTGDARVRWRTRNSGFRRLHVVLKLTDGTWLVSEQTAGESENWREQEFRVSDLRWYRLDVDSVTKGTAVDHPDLSRVDEIGFTDLMNGGGSSACSRLDWIEVYARPINRDPSTDLDRRWTRHEIMTGFQTQTAVAADFTGDGRLDVITGDIENDQRIFLYAAPNWRPTVLHSGVRLIQGAALDIDGDGDLDFIGAKYRPGLLFWLECPKDALRDPWPFHLIDGHHVGGVNGVHGLALGDMDRDGQLDLIAGSGWPEGNLPNSITWFKIPRNSRLGWERHVLAEKDAPGLNHYIGLGDVNGDGLPDVATGAKVPPYGNWFAWWEQPANPRRPWKKHLIAEGQHGATNILMADLNGDGKTDFLASRGHGQGVWWYEAPAWRRHAIDSSIVGPHALAAADIDGDGDIDAATCAKDSRLVAWFENEGQGKFKTHWIYEGQSAYEVRLVDMDGDGDPDLLVAGQESRNVVWFENRINPRIGVQK
jgi:hypothetical protein